MLYEYSGIFGCVFVYSALLFDKLILRMKNIAYTQKRL